MNQEHRDLRTELATPKIAFEAELSVSSGTDAQLAEKATFRTELTAATEGQPRRTYGKRSGFARALHRKDWNI